MAALQKPDYGEIYENTLVAFNEIEDFIGELAEMLMHLADALTHHPDEVELSPGAASNLPGLNVMDHDWPSFTRLQSLHQERRAARDMLMSAWNRLSEKERRTVSPLPPFDARDPTRTLV